MLFLPLELQLVFRSSLGHRNDGDANFIDTVDEIVSTKVSKKGGRILGEFVDGLGVLEHPASTYLNSTSFMS